MRGQVGTEHFLRTEAESFVFRGVSRNGLEECSDFFHGNLWIPGPGRCIISTVSKPDLRIPKAAAPVLPAPSTPFPRPTPTTVPVDFCENCGETRQLAKIKGCIRCLRCGFKADCSGM